MQLIHLSLVSALGLAFPQIQGWQGGDNALSVRMDAQKTLWLFSDSFVGPNRAQAKLVANTAAIQDAHGWRYFWGGGQVPTALMESGQCGCKYWPTHAFALGDTLYVLLHHVVPKQNAAATDIFSFNLTRTSLARIPQFRSSEPNQWAIDISELPSFIDANEWNGGATFYQGMVYILLGRLSKQYVLVRFAPDTPSLTEYLDKRGKWQAGFNRADAKIVLMGPAGGSLIYHPELQQWLMIFGPEFLSREIMQRRAEQLDGPWTPASPIYAPPEQVPGNAAYHDTYFCYSGREQADLPGPAVLTYDCNSSDFQRLVQTPAIYSPRMIYLPLK